MKLTPEVQSAMAEALGKGAHVTTACGAVGISVQTYYRWLDWGAAERVPKENDPADLTPYQAFREAVTAASHKIQLDALDAIIGGWKDNPELALKFLKSRFPGEWNVGVQRLEHSAGAPGSASLTEEERLAERLHGFLQGAADQAALDSERGVIDATAEPETFAAIAAAEPPPA